MPVIHEADKLYLGSSIADRVYLGANLVWPVAGPALQALINSLFSAGEQGAIYVPIPVVNGAQALFQDSAGTVPVTADGDPVGKMIDQSGNGNHATQSVSGSRPVYRTDGVLHWLEFDGFDDDIELPNSAFNFTGDQAVFIAAKHNTGSGGNIYLMGGDDKGYLFATASASNEMRFIPIGSGGSARSSSVIGTGPIVFGGNWNRTSGDVSLRENGAVYTDTGTPTDVTVPVVTFLGSGNPRGDNWDGRVYGMVAISVLLTPSETANVEDYLASLSGVTL